MPELIGIPKNQQKNERRKDMNETASVEEIFDVVNKLDEKGKETLLRLGKDILLIDEVRNEKTESN